MEHRTELWRVNCEGVEERASENIEGNTSSHDCQARLRLGNTKRQLGRDGGRKAHTVSLVSWHRSTPFCVTDAAASFPVTRMPHCQLPAPSYTVGPAASIAIVLCIAIVLLTTACSRQANAQQALHLRGAGSNGSLPQKWDLGEDCEQLGWRRNK